MKQAWRWPRRRRSLAYVMALAGAADAAFAGLQTGTQKAVDLRTLFATSNAAPLTYAASVGTIAGDGYSWTYTPTYADWEVYGDPANFRITITATDANGQTGVAETVQLITLVNTAPAGADSTGTFVSLAGSAPVIAPASSMPADGATGVNQNGNVVVAYDRPIKFGSSGTVTLRNVTDNSTIQTFNVATDQGTTAGKVSISGNNLTIRPTSALPTPSKNVSVQISAGAVTNLGGINCAAVADDTTLDFTTSGLPVRVGYKDGTGLSADYTIDISTGLSAMVSGDTPGTAQAGDWILVVQAQVTSNVDIAEAVTDNQGLTWTSLAESYADDSADTNLAAHWAQIGATVPTAITVKGSGASVNGAAARVFVYRNLDPTTPFSASATANVTNSGVFNAPSITPNKTNDDIWMFGANAQGATPLITGYSVSNMTVTPAFLQKLGSTRSVHIVSAYLQAPNTSPFDPAAVTPTGTDDVAYSGIAVSILARAP